MNWILPTVFRTQVGLQEEKLDFLVVDFSLLALLKINPEVDLAKKITRLSCEPFANSGPLYSFFCLSNLISFPQHNCKTSSLGQIVVSSLDALSRIRTILECGRLFAALV
jgi:hypothetical protein